MIESRTSTQTEMVNFMDDDVGKSLSELTNHMLRIDARLKQTNEVSLLLVYLNVLVFYYYVYYYCLLVR